MLSPGVSVVIPVYKSALILPALLARLEAVLLNCAVHFEVVLVCDGGAGDECWKLVRDRAGRCSWLRGLALAKNYGQHAATLAGIRVACYDRIVTLDDDLQHPPESIPQLLGRLTDDVDVVYGQPINAMGGPFRAFLSRSFRNTISCLTDISHTSGMTAFRAVRTSVRERFPGRRLPLASVDLLLALVTRRVAFVPVHFDPRLAGRSNYNLLKLTSMAFAWVLAANPKVRWWTICISACWLVLVILMLARLIAVLVSGSAILTESNFWGGFVVWIVALQLGLLGFFGCFTRQIPTDSSGFPHAIVEDKINFPGQNVS